MINKDTKTDEKTYVVYCHTCPNGVYYGVTCNTKRRWVQSSYTKSNTPFKDAIECFGWKNIKHEILYSDLTRDEALKIEDSLIVEARKNGTCLNMLRSGHFKQTEEFKEKDRNRSKDYYETHLEQRRVYRESHREQHNAESLAYYHRNKDRINERKREQRKHNKGGGDKPEPLF